MKYEIIGDNYQLLNVKLMKGESILSQTKGMLYMNNNIEMTTEVIGGTIKGLKRVTMDESYFITKFISTSDKGEIAFSGRGPGKLYKINSKLPFLCKKGSFLCASSNIDLDLVFTSKISSGLFGGNGFIFQKITLNNSDAFIYCYGDIIEKDLEKGEILNVSSGFVTGFENTVTYEPIMLKRIRNILFGGERLFVTRLTGPGKVILQSDLKPDPIKWLAKNAT